MIVVYVKHYLNEDGIKYFQDKWFPYVNKLIVQQLGFLDLTTSMNAEESGCVDITVKFKDEATLSLWVNHSDHAKVINDLDEYRTKNQRWFVAHDDKAPPPPLDQWEIAPLPEEAIAVIHCSPK